MRYAQGARRALRARQFDPEEIALILERFERTVPHLHFASWRVSSGTVAVDEDFIGEVLWKNNLRTEVEVALEFDQDIRISSTCRRHAGAVSSEDYRFLLALTVEAAGLTNATSPDGNVSLFEFGTSAVAAEIRFRANLDFDPTGIIRFVRSLSQETYENQRLAYGVIFSDRYSGFAPFARAFDNKRVKRLTDGFSTAIIVDTKGNIAGYTAFSVPITEGTRTSRRPWWTAGLAEATYRIRGVGTALLRSGDMVVLHNNRLQFSLRAGQWRIWNHAAILSQVRSAWSSRGAPTNIDNVLRYLYHVALDLSFRRSGGLLVLINRRSRLPDLLMSASDHVEAFSRGPAEQSLDALLTSAVVHRIDRRIIADLASLDGALVVDRTGHVLAYGAMTKSARRTSQGARTRAAIAASREGIAIKVSSDGAISFYARGDCFLEI
jgi:hypothetical protein